MPAELTFVESFKNVTLGKLVLPSWPSIHLSMCLSIHPSSHPSPTPRPSLSYTPTPTPTPSLFPKAAYNPLHLQKLRTLQPAKSRACDLASTTTESGRKGEKCREGKRERGLSIEEDDERARKREKEGGRQREGERRL